MDIHPNAEITELSYDTASSVDSIAPEWIQTDNLEFRAIFQVPFNEVRDLYRYVDDDVFANYGSARHMVPSETRDYVMKREQTWRGADWFEYILFYEGEAIGKTYLAAHGRLDAYTFGMWLKKDYWGLGLSQERADAMAHICFEVLDASYVDVGTVMQNEKSRRSIEKYIHRYNGSFYGCVPKSDAAYHAPVDDPTEVVRHPEWVITQEDYQSEERGISTLIPNVAYDEIGFDHS